MVTHDIRSAERGDRILYLKDGVITSELALGPYPVGDEGKQGERRGRLRTFLQEMGW